MGDGLFCSDPLILLHLHQPGDQVFGWGQSQGEARHGTPSHCLEVMNGLGGRSRVQQRRLSTGPPHQPFTLPKCWAPPHPPVKYHPNMESQIHSRQPGSSGRDSCHGSRSHLPPPLHRKVDSLKACMEAKGQSQPGRPWTSASTVPSCKPLCLPSTHKMYMMTPMAQQSTGRPYRCRPTTSGAANTVPIGQYQAWPSLVPFTPTSPLPRATP